MSLNFLEGTEKNYKTFSGKDFWARYLTCIFRKRSRTTRPLRTTYDHFKMVFWAITPNSVTVKRRQYVASKRQNEIIIQCSTTSQKFISWVVPGMKHWKLTTINLLHFVAKVRFSKRNVNIWTYMNMSLRGKTSSKTTDKGKEKEILGVVLLERKENWKRSRNWAEGLSRKTSSSSGWCSNYGTSRKSGLKV